MLLYVFFILLPATALSQCPRDVFSGLFKALDPNNDDNVELQECVNLFNVYDVNQNGFITEKEIKKKAPTKAPDFVGNERAVIDLLDRTGDGQISYTDIILVFYKADTDRNGLKSKQEYDRYVDKYCSKLEGQKSSYGEGNDAQAKRLIG